MLYKFPLLLFPVNVIHVLIDKGDVAQWLKSRNSNPKTLGSIPLVGQGESKFFCPSESTHMQTCLCLTPLRVYGTHLNLRACQRSHIHLL